nr:TPA_asm: hypothetical protein HUJ06_015906 [Nelumbo nucifera]
MHKVLAHRSSASFDQNCLKGIRRATANSLHILPNELRHVVEILGDVGLGIREKEISAAFVFFKTRYAAVIASQVLQSSNPMLWVTELAPEPHDVYWSNLWIPYRQLWFRRIATLLAAILFMFLFLVPVTFVQGLSQLEQLQQMFPFLKGVLRK